MLPGLMMDYPLTLDKIVEHAERMTPDKRVKTKLPAGGWHEYTYADFATRVRKLGAALAKLGVQPGDRVGTFAWNNYQHLECYFGIPGAGRGLPHAQYPPVRRAAALRHRTRRRQSHHRRWNAAALAGANRRATGHG